MKTKLKKLNKKTENVFRSSEVGALLERMEGKIDAIAEGQTIIKDELRDFKEETRDSFSKFFAGEPMANCYSDTIIL